MVARGQSAELDCWLAFLIIDHQQVWRPSMGRTGMKRRQVCPQRKRPAAPSMPFTFLNGKNNLLGMVALLYQ